MFSRRVKIILTIVIVAGFGSLLFKLWLPAPNLKLVVAPSPAQVVLDGKKMIKTGSYRLAEGNHTLKATMDGFADQTRSFTIHKDIVTVNIVLLPISEKGYAYFKNHPQEELRWEGLSGQNFNATNQQIAGQNPIVKLLPYVATDNSYRVDYGSVSGGQSNIYITAINNQAIQAARAWISSKGYDPTKLLLQTSTEPLLNHLPYQTTDFSLSASFTSSATGAPRLNIDAAIQLSHADESNQDVAVAQYKQEVLGYITSLGISPENYTITYSLHRA